MMDDPKFGPAASIPGLRDTSTDLPAEETKTATPAVETAPVSPAVEKFKSCRWRAAPEDGEFCTHRDVLPFAGKEGFSADSWCPECAFYKLRRTPKKRDRNDYMY
jgi:hypothetical protein